MAASSGVEKIIEWAESKPNWLQDALRTILEEGDWTPLDADRVVKLCIAENGGPAVQSLPRTVRPERVPEAQTQLSSVRLKQIAEVVGVNQLAPNQQLDFETKGLTIIYGQNGTGKSGYSRILKRACRSRRPGRIMPDVSSPTAAGKAKAKITILPEDQDEAVINWEDSDFPERSLSAITVFDRDSATVHVQESNEVWFRPFGLDIPDELAGFVQAIRDRLVDQKSDLETRRDPLFEEPRWHAETAIGRIMGSLTEKSDLASLMKISPLTPEQLARLSQLRSDLSEDPERAISKIERDQKLLGFLIGYLEQKSKQFGAEHLGEYLDLVGSAEAAQNAAKAAALMSFGDLRLGGVGEEEWRALWEAARSYTATLSTKSQAFPPNSGDICVLCHQDISLEAERHMHSFEKFVKEDLEAKSQLLQERLHEYRTRLLEAKLRIVDIGEIHAVLRSEKPFVAKLVSRFIGSLKIRQRQIKSREVSNLQDFYPLTDDPVPELKKYGLEKVRYLNSLNATEDDPERQKLISEFHELEDMEKVEIFQQKAQTERDRLRKLKVIEDCIRQASTRTITELGNKIADEVVTPRLRDKFQNEITALAGNRVRVEIRRAGGKYGSPLYQVRLFANASVKVHEVLSEGEQTCVALAAYLAELATADHSSTLVFDDPVTSLDHKWRNRVAIRLCEEARTRQVVVFTHDLIFTNDLMVRAESEGTPYKCLNLSRGSAGVGVVSEGLPWRGAKVKERVDTLEKEASAAKKLYDGHEESDYRRAAHNFYNRLRSSWERALEDIVFAGVVMRHRDYIDTKRLHEVLALSETDVGIFQFNFKKCCDYVDAHDPSRGRDAEAPDPKELQDDLYRFKVWSEDLRRRCNAIPLKQTALGPG